MGRIFKPLLASTHLPTPPKVALENIIKQHFTLRAFLAVGATLQILLQLGVSFLPIPQYLAILPALLVITLSTIDSAWQASHPDQNTLIADVLPGRTAAVLPDLVAALNSDNNEYVGMGVPSAARWFGVEKPAQQGLVVFHLGLRVNHPLGWASPDAAKTAQCFEAIAKSLGGDDASSDAHDRYGLMGMTTFSSMERETNNTMIIIMYFRDVEGLHRLAHDDAHMQAWRWYADERKGRYVSAFHETFVVEPGAYETLYLDSAPSLLGAAAVKRTGKDGKPEWVHTVVDAKHPSMKGMTSRMNRAPVASV